ncbi:hypothetical protein GCM10010441_72910 [Kitasatospora paracochleata]|uniref:DUF4304 domain-containing protein n=1 Tax=Kitasatospora paracochleata TaxID=58354 RepID=A0ABT1J6C8_9ACTN|nr:hypothetical protein [Kitasatospora paracochleata]MCP2312784.1 hypothetical protein [Kitasatospora paracochleata]
MTSARELFDRGMRDHFAPALRAMGLTGWRHSFSVPDPARWAVLGVRAEPGTHGRSVRYTLNLSVTAKAAWDGRTIRPDANAVSGLESWRAPIGDLLPVGGEVWWEVGPGPRWLVAVEDSIAAVRHYGLPELLRRLTATPDTYLSPAELDGVNTALADAAVARIQRAELVGGCLLLHGAWQRGDRVARRVLEGTARGFLSARDERFARVRVLDTLGRDLWAFGELLAEEGHH